MHQLENETHNVYNIIMLFELENVAKLLATTQYNSQPPRHNIFLLELDFVSLCSTGCSHN
jgi:hypothetical protein